MNKPQLFSEPIECKNEFHSEPVKLSAGITDYGSNKWIKMACDVAVESVKNNGGPFGAVLLHIDTATNKVMRYWKGNNQVTIQNDPTAHAEVSVIRSACNSLGVFNLGVIEKDASNLPQDSKLSHCVIYSSCEPCPMCYSAIFWARIPSIFFSATKYDAQAPGVNFSDAEIYEELNLPYYKRKTKVYHCKCEQATASFKLWKKTDKTTY